MKHRTFTLFSLIFLLFAQTVSLSAQDWGACCVSLGVPYSNWNSVNWELNRALLTEDLGTLAQAELTASRPQTPQAWLRRLALFLRADYRQEAFVLLQSRPSFLSPKVPWAISSAVAEADTYNDLAIAKRLCELFPEETSPVGWFEKWEKTISQKEADRWLKAQGEAESSPWFYERFRLWGNSDEGAKLLVPLAKAIKESPEDEDCLSRYLTAVEFSERNQSNPNLQQRSRKTDWLSSVLKPRRAVQSYLIGIGLYSAPRVEQALLERSLGQPFTAEDVEFYSQWDKKHSFGSFRQSPLTERELRRRTISALLMLYRQGNETKKIRELLKKMAKGQTIIALPSQNLLSQDYWLSLGQVFSECGKDEEAVNAFEKALSLSLISDPNEFSRRYQILLAYTDHFARQRGLHFHAVYEFLHRQLECSQKPDYLSYEVVSVLLHFLEHHPNDLAFDNPLLWAYLARQMSWGEQEQLLLQRLLEVTPEDKREEQWKRAEVLPVADALSQRVALAKVMKAQHEEGRAARLLRSVLPQAADRQDRFRFMQELWECDAQTGNLDGMKQIFGEWSQGGLWDRKPLTAFLELETVAERWGKTKDALAFFKQWSNQDRRSAPNFFSFFSAVVLSETRAFYHELEKRELQSDTPRRVWKAIGR